MQAIKTIYDDLPGTINIPDKWIHRKAEVIIILEDETPKGKKHLIDFFGILPDFPDRFPQGEYERREPL